MSETTEERESRHFREDMAQARIEEGVATNKATLTEQHIELAAIRRDIQELRESAKRADEWMENHEKASCELMRATNTLVKIAENMDTLGKLRRWAVVLLIGFGTVAAAWGHFRDLFNFPKH
jgi:hypothetical protein